MRTLILMLLFVMLLAPAVYPSELYIRIRHGEVEEIIPFEYNMYYQEKFYFAAGEESGTADRTVRGNEIQISTESDVEHHLFSGIDFSEDYVITVDGVSQEVSFCNNDGQCQPCFEGLCDNVENHLTCPEDCPSGTHDNYCDLERDGVCDPDCEEYDFDCDACIENVCLYAGMEVQTISCSEIGGNVCSPREDCGGFMTYADDVGMDCCIGDCVVPTTETEPDRGEERPPLPGDERIDDSVFQQETQQDPTFIYLLAMSAFLLIALGLTVISQYKTIMTEHQMRKYVHDMAASGYTIDQIEAALVQQGYEKELVEKVCKRYRK